MVETEGTIVFHEAIGFARVTEEISDQEKRLRSGRPRAARFYYSAHLVDGEEVQRGGQTAGPAHLARVFGRLAAEEGGLVAPEVVRNGTRDMTDWLLVGWN